MEEEAPVKPSVAQLAGKLKAHALPMPGNMEVKSMRRPPCSLAINDQKDEEHEEKSSVCPHPAKIKMKSSPLIEKLQANLALSPTVLLSPPKSPESKQPPSAAISPCSGTSSTLQTPQLSCEDEAPISFEQPVEGTPLPSINKSRARLSFKRRLPTRLHRKSASEENKVQEDSNSQLETVQQNGEDLICGRLQEDNEEKENTADSAQTRTEDRANQETNTGDQEEECEASDCKQEEEEKEEAEEDRTEVKEDTVEKEAE
ncbi:capZ-interacting protein [Danio aesculapii]|uniref:capZ-interacting protein n=1 Tax=Danio aesculapii TaxID=1142201 RepID=UPI0024BFAB08|nr:capZ-interacting protein [Danio aesculapii]